MARDDRSFEVVTDEIGSTSDLLATFLWVWPAAPCRTTGRWTASIWGRCCWAPGPGRGEEMPFYRGSELYAYRVGNYKAHFITRGEYGLGGERMEHDPPLLYDLALDPGEQWNIAEDRQPEALAEVTARAVQHRAGVAVAPSQLDRRTGD